MSGPPPQQKNESSFSTLLFLAGGLALYLVYKQIMHAKELAAGFSFENVAHEAEDMGLDVAEMMDAAGIKENKPDVVPDAPPMTEDGQPNDDPEPPPESTAVVCLDHRPEEGKCKSGYITDETGCCVLPDPSNNPADMVGSLVTEIVVGEAMGVLITKLGPGLLNWGAGKEITEEGLQKAFKGKGSKKMIKNLSKRLAKLSKGGQSIGKKLVSKMIGKTAAKMAAKLAAKLALKMAKLNSPLIIFDIFSLLLDFADPSGYNNFTENKIIQDAMSVLYYEAEKQAKRDGVAFPQVFPLRTAFPDVYDSKVTPVLQDAFLSPAIGELTEEQTLDLLESITTETDPPDSVLNAIAANMEQKMEEEHLKRDQIIFDALVGAGISESMIQLYPELSTGDRLGVSLSKRGVGIYNSSKKRDWFKYNDLFDTSIVTPDDHVPAPVALFTNTYFVQDKESPGTSDSPNMLPQTVPGDAPVALTLHGGHLVAYCEKFRNAKALGGLLPIDDMNKGIDPTDFGVYFDDGTGDLGAVGCVYTDKFCTRMGLKHNYNHTTKASDCSMDGGQVVGEILGGTTVFRDTYRGAHKLFGFDCDPACKVTEYCEGHKCNPKKKLGEHVGMSAWWKCLSGHEAGFHCVECHKNEHCDGNPKTSNGLDCTSKGSCFCDGHKCHKKLEAGQPSGALGGWKCKSGVDHNFKCAECGTNKDCGVKAGDVQVQTFTKEIKKGKCKKRGIVGSEVARRVTGRTTSSEQCKYTLTEVGCKRKPGCTWDVKTEVKTFTKEVGTSSLYCDDDGKGVKRCLKKLAVGEPSGILGAWKCISGKETNFHCAGCHSDKDCDTKTSFCGTEKGDDVPNPEQTQRCVPKKKNCLKKDKGQCTWEESGCHSGSACESGNCDVKPFQQNRCRKPDSEGDRADGEFCNKDDQCTSKNCKDYLCKAKSETCTTKNNNDCNKQTTFCDSDKECQSGRCHIQLGQQNACRLKESVNERGVNKWCEKDENCTTNRCKDWICIVKKETCTTKNNNDCDKSNTHCDEDLDCKSGRCDKPAFQASVCRKTMSTNQRGDGEWCENDTNCSTNRCKDWQCIVKRDTCTVKNNKDCTGPTHCDDNKDCKSGRCHKPALQQSACRKKETQNQRADGEWCEKDGNCKSVRCKDWKCIEKRDTCHTRWNNDCGKNTECDNDLDCKDGRCHKVALHKNACRLKSGVKRLDGQFCEKDAECDTNSRCFQNMCKAKQPTCTKVDKEQCTKQNECGNNTDCVSGKCDTTPLQRFVCRLKDTFLRRPDNDFCNRDGQCLGGWCKDWTCTQKAKTCTTTDKSKCASNTECNSAAACESGNCDQTIAQRHVCRLQKSSKQRPNNTFCDQAGQCASNVCDGWTCVQCTQNSHCGNQRCKNRTCVPKIANGRPNEGSHTNCASGHDQHGTCVQCNHSNHCGGGSVCLGHQCKPKIANGQPHQGSHQNCASGHEHWGKCVQCKSHGHCGPNRLCLDQTCHNKIANGQPDRGHHTHCASGHNHAGKCVACWDPSHCGNNKACVNYSCRNKVGNGQPHGGSVSNCASGMEHWGKCVQCKDNNHCGSGKFCGNNVCHNKIGNGQSSRGHWTNCASGHDHHGKCVACHHDHHCGTEKSCRSHTCHNRPRINFNVHYLNHEPDMDWKGWSDQNKCVHLRPRQFCTCGAGKRPGMVHGGARCSDNSGHSFDGVSCSSGRNPKAWRQGWEGWYCT